MIRTNPITGLPEDDGLPDPALVDAPAPALLDAANPDIMPVVQPVLDQQGQGAAAPTAPAAAAPPVAVFPPKPEHESKSETSSKTGGVIESAATRAADAKLQEAREKSQAAIDAETQIKLDEAEAKKEDAKLARLALEKKNAGEAYWTDQKRRKIEENMAADKAAVEQSAKDEELKNSAGILTGAAKTWATVLEVIGTIGQGLAAAGSRGAQAWQDGNPIAKLYEADRQKAQAQALADFKKSERYRELQKAGRDAELKTIEDRLTIGVNNEFKRDTEMREALLAERLAKRGPQAQKIAGDVLKAGKAEVYATIDRENAAKYDEHFERGRSFENVNRSPTSPAGASANATKTLVLDKDGNPVGNAPNEQQSDKLAELRRATAKQEVLRNKLAELAPQLSAADRLGNKVVKDKLQQDFDTALYDLGSQVSIANGQASMTGAERKDFEANNGRGWLQEGKDFAALQAEKQKQAWDQYDNAAKATVIGGTEPTKATPVGSGGPKSELGRAAAARMAPPSWKGVRKVISSGTYERTGPGPNDWKKVKGN